MKTVLSNEYLIWIEKLDDNELYLELSQGSWNWFNFKEGNSVYIETELFDYEFVVEYISHGRQLVVLE